MVTVPSQASANNEEIIHIHKGGNYAKGIEHQIEGRRGRPVYSNGYAARRIKGQPLKASGAGLSE